jgi:hypothetical protein
VGRRLAKDLLVALPVALTLSGSLAHALSPDETNGQSPLTIDDLGFGAAMDSRVFSSSYRITSATSLATPADVARGGNGQPGIATTLEFDTRPAAAAGLGLEGTGRDPVDDEVAIRRFSTALKASSGTLTVGNDWSNFQDYLSGGVPASLSGRGLTSEQVNWASSGELGEFSVALEKNYDFLGQGLSRSLGDDLTGFPTGSAADSANDPVTGSPSLVLSWRGTTADRRGRYSFSALGRELEASEFDSAPEQDATGWGVNLAGGWHFGELFAALSVTLGNSIDSFILGRVGDAKTASEAARFLSPSESININPSLSYRLGENANLHFALNRFATESGSAPHGVDTLDTVHLGYSWAPWPSTRIGIEIVGKDVEGRGAMEDSNEVNFAASKRF